MDMLTDSTKQLVRKLREIKVPMTGAIAFALAHHFHSAGMDSHCQWGNAYFLCPDCDHATDCSNDFEDPYCFHCGAYLTVEHMRISEEWVERL